MILDPVFADAKRRCLPFLSGVDAPDSGQCLKSGPLISILRRQDSHCKTCTALAFIDLRLAGSRGSL